MNILISILYAPLIVFSLKYFDIKTIAITIFFTSFLWLFFSYKKGFKESLYPLVYILVACITYFIEAFVVLKILPLLISFVISSIIFISYLNHKSIILYFAQRFSKKEISSAEQAYIQSSTLFWSIVGFINTALHGLIFVDDNIQFWVYYSSIGWYFIFIIAGLIQFLHRKFVFLKRIHD